MTLGGLSERVERGLKVLRRMIGVPDYDSYCAYLAQHHPGEQPMSRNDFHRERLTEKYTRPGNRCC
jgi:uncharacterized short protein YbdD (DUF466 family)